MNVNILRLIHHVVKEPETDLRKVYKLAKKDSTKINRANTMGDALEFYIKDKLCSSKLLTEAKEKKKLYEQSFSWQGTQNHPPDIIIKKSDAIEVKKITGWTSTIALNSSQPKQKLRINNNMLTEACRTCESDWDEKDFAYIIGVVKKHYLRVLSIVYGDCYAAPEKVYEELTEDIKKSLKKSVAASFETNELGRVNKVDPSEVTSLRIRGMWQIENPLTTFSDIMPFNKENKLNVFCLMSEEKYDSMPKKDRKLIEENDLIIVSTVKIPDPSEKNRKIKAKLIKSLLSH